MHTIPRVGPQVIERRPTVMHNVANDDAEWNRRLDHYCEAHPNSAIFSIQFSGESCGTTTKVGKNLSLKSFEMFFGPEDFRVNAL